jgi:hypothetical protein
VFLRMAVVGGWEGRLGSLLLFKHGGYGVSGAPLLRYFLWLLGMEKVCLQIVVSRVLGVVVGRVGLPRDCRAMEGKLGGVVGCQALAGLQVCSPVRSQPIDVLMCRHQSRQGKAINLIAPSR